MKVLWRLQILNNSNEEGMNIINKRNDYGVVMMSIPVKMSFRRLPLLIFALLLLPLCACIGENPEAAVNESDDVVNDKISHLSDEMVFVKGGIFTMGCTSEQSNDCDVDIDVAHQVTLNDFYIGKYEVTQAQWKAVMGNNPSFFIGDDLPVDSVSWNDTQEFIRKLNERTGGNYRLPTEAEWEYAARGGNQSKGYKYSGSNDISDVAWYRNNSAGRTNPVGTKDANELGIHDMTGNVWEQVHDWYSNYSGDPQVYPMGPISGTNRVGRGGCWFSDEWVSRVSNRTGGDPDGSNNYFGFRLARSLRGNDIIEAAQNVDKNHLELIAPIAKKLADSSFHDPQTVKDATVQAEKEGIGNYTLVKGEDYRICKEFLENLNFFKGKGETPMACDMRIAPQFEKFRTLDWEDMPAEEEFIKNLIYDSYADMPKDAQDNRWKQFHSQRLSIYKYPDTEVSISKTPVQIFRDGRESYALRQSEVNFCTNPAGWQLFILADNLRIDPESFPFSRDAGYSGGDLFYYDRRIRNFQTRFKAILDPYDPGAKIYPAIVRLYDIIEDTNPAKLSRKEICVFTYE